MYVFWLCTFAFPLQLEKVVYKALQLSPEKQSFLHYFLFGENSAAKVDIFNNHLLVNAAKGKILCNVSF